jgi:hypothetical protein
VLFLGFALALSPPGGCFSRLRFCALFLALYFCAVAFTLSCSRALDFLCSFFARLNFSRSSIFHARTFALLDFALVISCLCDRTARTGHSEQDRQNRTARTGQPEQDSQNRTARTGQAEQDSLNRRARTGQPGHESQDMKARTEQPGT